MGDKALAVQEKPVVMSAEDRAVLLKANLEKKTLDELVALRLRESQMITVVTDDTSYAHTDAQLALVVQARNQIAESSIRAAATHFGTIHRKLTGWLKAWNDPLVAREESLSAALVDYQERRKKEAEAERLRLEREAQEKARIENERLRKEAEARAKEMLDAAEQDRQDAMFLLAKAFASLNTSQGKRSQKETVALAQRHWENINQVQQDTMAARAALDSLSQGNVEEAVRLMKFTKEQPAAPPPPLFVETVQPEPVATLTEMQPAKASSLRGTQMVPRYSTMCEHEDGDDEGCPECLKIPRKFLKIDHNAVGAYLRKQGEAMGGTPEQPNFTAIPGLRIYWTREPRVKRS
jgi:hypothetical protein